MTNGEIADVFAKIALILDIKGGENPYRIRAYERAAVSLENLREDVGDIYEAGGIDSLKELPGIGKDLAQKIEELLISGELQEFESLKKRVAPGLFKIMDIEGLGPKKIKFLWKTFDIKTIKDLLKVCKSGKLEEQKGWGKKSVENILKGIEQQKKMSGRLPIGDALPLAEDILEALEQSKLCDQVAIAGSLRRRKETVGDIDILVTSKKSVEVMKFFCSLPQAESVTVQGDIKSTVFLKAGIDCDIRVVDSAVFGAALQYFTGSKGHNVRLRKLGIKNGMTISEYGVYKGTAKKKEELLASRSEEDVYEAVGLPYIEPELREDHGEMQAALDGELPDLVELEDLRGDLHMHSTFSDGKASMEEMAKAAKDLGLSYIAMADHASPMGMVKGIKKENIKEYLDRIRAAREKVKGIHILAGAEVDILENGELYLPDDVLKELDWVVASVHQNFKQSKERVTERVCRALQNPYICVLGHPTGRLLGKREGIALEMETVLREAKKNNVAIELNASPKRLDISDTHCHRAKELGVPVLINSDAHTARGLRYQYGIWQARRGWLEKGDVLNTLPWEKFEEWRAKRV